LGEKLVLCLLVRKLCLEMFTNRIRGLSRYASNLVILMGFCRYSGTPESPSRQHPRSAVITAKLEDIRVQTERSRAALASEMRQIRNFAILTPLRKSTRDRIVGEFEPLARRVKQLRLQIQKLECEREVLHAELMSFEEEISDSVPQPEQSRTEIQREPSPAVRESRNHPTDSQPESLAPGVENRS